MSYPRPLAYILADSIVKELKAIAYKNNDIAQSVLKNFGLPNDGQVGKILVKMIESKNVEEFRRLYNEIAADPDAHAKFNSLVLSFHDHLEMTS